MNYIGLTLFLQHLPKLVPKYISRIWEYKLYCFRQMHSEASESRRVVGISYQPSHRRTKYFLVSSKLSTYFTLTDFFILQYNMVTIYVIRYLVCRRPYFGIHLRCLIGTLPKSYIIPHNTQPHTYIHTLR